jgi:hypothetical protein
MQDHHLSILVVVGVRQATTDGVQFTQVNRLAPRAHIGFQADAGGRREGHRQLGLIPFGKQLAESFAVWHE